MRFYAIDHSRLIILFRDLKIAIIQFQVSGMISQNNSSRTNSSQSKNKLLPLGLLASESTMSVLPTPIFPCAFLPVLYTIIATLKTRRSSTFFFFSPSYTSLSKVGSSNKQHWSYERRITTILLFLTLRDHSNAPDTSYTYQRSVHSPFPHLHFSINFWKNTWECVAQSPLFLGRGAAHIFKDFPRRGKTISHLFVARNEF